MDKVLKVDVKQDVTYCIPLWLRDEQIKRAIARTKARIAPHHEKRNEPIAVVCFGASLQDTWQLAGNFKYVISCSGSHKFLIERGIIPTWHVEVDPRKHKVELIGPPHKNVEYLIASTCHPAVFDHLDGYNVKVWHVFEGAADALRTLPAGEWALTGGCGVGLRAMTIARFFGFTDMHIFGMDGCDRDGTGKHAAAHPNEPKKNSVCEYDGKTYYTTPTKLEAARGTWHELDQMPDVKATFYGEGLVQHMAKKYVPKPVSKGKALIGYSKPELISQEMRRLNVKLHETNLAYGVGGDKHAPVILKIAEALKTKSILDYGCGKSLLAKAIPYPIWEYDPAVPGKDESPRPADLVVCTDVLEHIEEEYLPFVLDDLRRCVLEVGYFVIHTGPSSKTLEDGRNAHVLQRGKKWWVRELAGFFKVGKVFDTPPLVRILVAPLAPKRVIQKGMKKATTVPQATLGERI